MEEALTALLLASAGVVALVGDRVHWLVQPNEVAVFPYLNLQVVSGGIDYSLQGPIGVRMMRVQMDAWAESYAAQKAVERALIAAVSGFRGDVAGGRIDAIFVVGIRDLPEQTDAGERRLFRTSLDVQIGWAPTGG